MLMNEFNIINNIYNLKILNIYSIKLNKKTLYLKKKQDFYIFRNLNNVNNLIDYSFNLYIRINSYFIDSLLNFKVIIILVYFNKYNEKLNLFNLEQYFIRFLRSNLDSKIDGSSLLMLELIKRKGQKVYIYCQYCYNLLYIFNSREDLINKIKINKKTLKSCVNKGIVYLKYFLLSNEINLNWFNNFKLLDENQITKLIQIIKDFHFIKYTKNNIIIAEYIGNYSFKKQFNSLKALTLYLKGNKITILKYLNNTQYKLYRNKWFLNYIN